MKKSNEDAHTDWIESDLVSQQYEIKHKRRKIEKGEVRIGQDEG